MSIQNRQLPLVGIDGLQAWQTGELSLVNRVPDAGSIDAGKDADIEFQLLNATGAVTYPSDLVVLAKYNDTTPSFDLDYVRDAGSPTGATTGSPTIDTADPKFGAGNLLLNATENVVYSGSNIIDALVQTGCVSLWFKANYTGTPSQIQTFYYSDYNYTVGNRIWLMHHTDGKLYFYASTAGGSGLVNISSAWSADTNWHNLEGNFNVSGGQSRLFFDGGQIGSTDTSTGSRSGTANKMAVGRSYIAPVAQNVHVDQVMAFDVVQHTANFTSPTTETEGFPFVVVDQSSLDVWVKKSAGDSFEQAVDDGVAQGSWGLDLSTLGPGNIDLKAVLDTPYTLDSEAVVSVRVVADVIGGGFAIDETYSFTVEDHLQPQMTAAVGKWRDKVDVTFNEDMGVSALVAANYSIAPYLPDRRAAVTPTVTSVVELSAVSFELTTNWELTPGAQYEVTAATAIQDEAGNGMDPTADSAVFTAYDYRDSRRDFDGWRIYEQMSDYDRRRDMSGDLERFCEVRQNATDLALMHVDDLRDLTDPDFCTVEYLDHLLYDRGNPLPFVTDEKTKRKIAWRCKELNKKRGTDPGIVLSIDVVLGLDCEVVHDRTLRWKLGFQNEDVEATVNELYLDYEAHRILTTGSVHGAADGTNVVLSSLYPASGEAETVALLNAILTAYEAHRVLTAASVHGAADSTNVVYRAAATDWTTAANLSGELRRKYEAHRILITGSVHGAADTVNVVENRPGDCLNFDTILGGGRAVYYSFWLEFYQALTAAETILAGLCANAMKTAHTHYLGTIEP